MKATTDAREWYPVHPRWLPLLRVVGILGVLGVACNLVHERSWSSLLPLGVPVVVILHLLLVRPELRPRTFLNRLGMIAHGLLIFLILPLAVVSLLVSISHI